jgi:hypothetical protein
MQKWVFGPKNVKKSPNRVKYFFLQIGRYGYKNKSEILRWFQMGQFTFVACAYQKFLKNITSPLKSHIFGST